LPGDAVIELPVHKRAYPYVLVLKELRCEHRKTRPFINAHHD
jgi:hypothetical protein